MRVLTFLSAVFLGSLALPVLTAVAAEETPSPTAQQSALMEKFAGSWKAEGTSFGLPSKSTMVWTRDLAGKFYRVEYRIDMDSKGKTQSFIGHGYYKASSNNGFWADTGGDLHPLVMRYSADNLTTIWGKAGGKQGRSSYTLREDGSIEVVDWILLEKGWREFNRTLFTRAG